VRLRALLRNSYIFIYSASAEGDFMSAEKKPLIYFDIQQIPDEAITEKDLVYMSDICTDYLEIDKPDRTLRGFSIRLIVDYFYTEQDE
jgi:hypothetical protein